MASLAANTVARLRACRDAGLPVPSDLLADAIACLERNLDAAAMRESRDLLIRRAALLLPGSAYQRAALLADEARVLARVWPLYRTKLPANPPTSVRDMLHAARLRAELPASQRQFYRVLQLGEGD